MPKPPLAVVRAFSLLVAVVAAADARAQPPSAPPCKVFILAGQSNMEGHGVVAPAGGDHADGRGTLEWAAREPRTAPMVAHLRNADGTWKVRDDVFVRYTPEGKPAKVGALALGFTPYLDASHFGPELQFGQVMGDAIDGPVLLVKTAWGGKSLFKDFRPPSSGGQAGPYYERMVRDVCEALAKAGDEIPALRGPDGTLRVTFVPTLPPAPGSAPEAGELSGYMLVPVERVPEEFNGGFSLYAAAWPLVERYPGSRFQSGLFGTWMFAQYARGADGKHDPADKPKDMYSDIEGGLGWWRDTRFATATPKFIMGGVAPDFVAWANGPGAGKGRDWDKPLGKYAVAQLSPWVVWPPDGLNLAQGTCGELFGYGYVPLPFVDAKQSTDGTPLETGGNCWTLFLSTANFRGPVAFFTPHFWAETKRARPELAGKLLDTRPSDPNKAFQMETQWIPASIGAKASDGAVYARIAPTAFPVDAAGRTVVLHRLTSYAPAALTDGVRAWFAGGPAASGVLDPAASHVQRFGQGGGSTWRIFGEGVEKDARGEVDWKGFSTPAVHDGQSFGYSWGDAVTRRQGDGARVWLPEYFRLVPRDGKAPAWQPVDASAVPPETGLAAVRFDTPRERGQGAYTTPDAPASAFRTPGPAAGPFQTTLGDGSTVTYCWYRFADQPAMLNAGLTDSERAEAQRRVELVHRAWTKDRDYIARPTTGTLASIDPALIVTPPKGMEVGFVPIAVRQERRAQQ
ncbi:MAG: sialate O-acetylesterase [Planctomycetota bacterium]